jgi:hypothetical protein
MMGILNGRYQSNVAQFALQVHENIKRLFIGGPLSDYDDEEHFRRWWIHTARSCCTTPFRHALETKRLYPFSRLSLADNSFWNSGEVLVKAIDFAHVRVFEVFRSHHLTDSLSSLNELIISAIG